MRPNARIRETFEHSVSHSRLWDKLLRLFGGIVFTALDLFRSKLPSKSSLDEEIKIEHAWACEAYACIRVILLGRAPQGLGPLEILHLFFIQFL